MSLVARKEKNFLNTMVNRVALKPQQININKLSDIYMRLY